VEPRLKVRGVICHQGPRHPAVEEPTQGLSYPRAYLCVPCVAVVP
jgi:hypothetical protein